jgi:hypothetical protein
MRELWQVLRAAIQPAFHAQRINAYASMMVDYTKVWFLNGNPVKSLTCHKP